MTTHSAASPSRPHLRQPRSRFRPRRAPAGPWSACGLAQPVVARMPRPRPFTQAPPARAVAPMPDLTRRRARAWPSSRTSCWTPTPTQRNWSTASHTTRRGQHTSTIYARSSARVGKCSHGPLPRDSGLAVGTTWGRSMFVELDTRRGDGLTVTLEWDRDTGHTQIVVHDMRSDGLIAFVVPPVSAADAFRHPFRYAP